MAKLLQNWTLLCLNTIHNNTNIKRTKDIVAEPKGKKSNVLFVRNFNGVFVEVFVYECPISNYVQVEVCLVILIRIIRFADWGQSSNGSYVE
jgi:hypothetical protein